MPGRLLALLTPPACWSCGAAAPREEPLCARCDGALPWLGERLGAAPLGTACALDALWTPLAFEGPARDLVHALKFRGAERLAPALARDMLDRAPPGLLAAPAALVPVPAHPWRRRLRGFDHAAALAAAIGAISGRPVLDALSRRGAPGTRQRGLGREQRLAGAALAVHAMPDHVPRAAVLVDDVCTTGATLAACAAALRLAGASSVAAVVYARAL